MLFYYMNPQKHFDAFISCVIGDSDLKDFLEDLIDSNVLSVVYPPVKVKLVVSDRTFMVKITDGVNSYVMRPIDIDDNMLQDIQQTYHKYKPEESESESESESARDEFLKRFRPDKD